MEGCSGDTRKAGMNMQIVQMMKRGNRFLLARVVDEDALHDNYIKAHFKIGEVYEYVVCRNYNGNEWDGGQYFGYRYLQNAMDAFNAGHSITWSRMSELATLFKDVVVDELDDGGKEFFIEECDMGKDELEYFGIEIEDDEEDEDIPYKAFTPEYLNYIGMSMDDFI